MEDLAAHEDAENHIFQRKIHPKKLLELLSIFFPKP
jgi:hypothetical protein